MPDCLYMRALRRILPLVLMGLAFPATAQARKRPFSYPARLRRGRERSRSAMVSASVGIYGDASCPRAAEHLRVLDRDRMRFAMKRITLLAIAMLVATPLQAQDAEVSSYTIDQFMETVWISTTSLSADGETILFTSDASGVPNAYAVPFGGGDPVQLTHSADAIQVHGYFPADERFLYSADEGGNELTHIYVRNPDGIVEDLTPGENVRALFLGWSPDGHAFFIATNERDPRRMDVYEMSLDGFERTLLYRNDRGVRVGAISPDRRLLAFVRLNSNRDSDLFLYDRQTGQETLLSSGEEEARPRAHGFGADGRHLYYTTDRDSDFRYLVRYDVETGEHRTVLRPAWDVENVSLSPGGRYLAAAVNVDARTEVHLLETATLEPVPLPSLLSGDITAIAFSRDERRLAFLAGSGRSPGDLYVLDLDQGEPRVLVPTLSPEIDPEHLVEPEVVRFASFDGLEIPGLLYRPHTASPDAPVPAMIWLRGSTDGQARVAYYPLIQYLVNRGYAVYAINHRGSSGYGRSFRFASDGRRGEADLGDVIASKRMLIETGWIDPGRIGVMGPSYGGFMTMAALAFHPEEFAVGVNLYGVTNWIRTLEGWATHRPWSAGALASFYAEMGDPVADRERLRRISPLFHADRITKPFLVLHGANDQRVLQIESDEIVAAARANGVPVEYIVFPDEGHGFRKKENQQHAYEAILDFLDRYLKGNE
jgi:dipeptidyl aminopeptidase/acylaminoacyl peptidase